MLMIVETVNQFPVLVPVEHKNALIVSATKNVWQSRMHNNMSDKVTMLARNSLDFLTCVVVIYTNARVI